MRIVHFADLHLGIESYGRIDPATGVSSRLNDFLSALDRLVDYDNVRLYKRVVSDVKPSDESSSKRRDPSALENRANHQE